MLAIGLGVVLGAAIELVLLRHLRSADIDITMLVMIGAWIVLQNTEQLAWTGVAQSIANPFPADPLVLGAVSVSWNRVFVFVVAVALIAGTYALVNHTRLGMAMRATFQDREAAALMGVSIERIHTATFALGSGLAAAAGALLGPIFVVTPTMGDLAAAKAFAIVILGGMGSLAGATVGALHSRFRRGDHRGLHLVGLSRRDGLSADHPHIAVPADRFVRAEGADQLSRWAPGARPRGPAASVPLWVTSLYVLHILITTGIFIIAAMSLNLLLGYTGQLSLGHVAFFGIGAYTSALISLGFDSPSHRRCLARHRAAAGVARDARRPRRRGAVRLRRRQDRVSRCAAPISSSCRSASPRWCASSRSTGSS